MSRGVFVSYRRSDSQSATGRMCDHLRLNGFGASGALFLDIDNVPPGADFREVIKETLDQCDVVLVVIGPSWLNAQDAQGRRRLDMPSDTHRIEVESALNSSAIVIPVLVEGAQHPSEEDLPAGLSPLAFRNSWLLSDRRFAGDVTGLAEHIRRMRSERDVEAGSAKTSTTGQTLPPAAEPTEIPGGLAKTGGNPSRRGLLWGLGGVGVVAVVVLGLAVGLSGGSGTDRAAIDTVAPTSSTSTTEAVVEVSTTLAPVESADPPSSTTSEVEEPATTAQTGVELPDRFATTVPSADCTGNAIERDLGSWAAIQPCVGPWTVAAISGGSDVDVFRWDGEKWTYRGSRSLSCVENFVSLGMSIYDAAEFGASARQTTRCRLDVNWLSEPASGPLRRGDQGPRTQQLQMRLANLGLLFTVVDDLFGLNTAAAIVDLKLLLGLATLDTVDGVADEQILELLG